MRPIDLGFSLSAGVLTIRLNGWWIELEAHRRTIAVEWGSLASDAAKLTAEAASE